MEDTNRVKNIKEKFEILNFNSDASVSVSNVRNNANFRSFANGSGNMAVDRLPSRQPKREVISSFALLQDNNNNTTCNNRCSNVKRTPAFRRDKCLVKSNSLLNVNKRNNNVSSKVKQFNNFNQFATTASSVDNNLSSHSGCENQRLNFKTEAIICDDDINNRLSSSANSAEDRMALKRLGQLIEDKFDHRKIVHDLKINDKFNEPTNFDGNGTAYSVETLKKVLQSPLPPGPPPKKPPRTFSNTDLPSFKREITECPEILENAGDIADQRNVETVVGNVNNCQRSVKSIKSKMELEAMLRKLEIVFEKKIADFDKCVKNPLPDINATVAQCVRVTAENTSDNLQSGNSVQGENIYAEPVGPQSNFFIDLSGRSGTNFQDHIYEEPDKLFKDRTSKEDKLYYMSTAIDTLLQQPPTKFKNDNSEVSIVLEKDRKEPSMDSSFQNTRVRDWVNEIYARPWSKWPDDGSDSDSAISLSDEVSSRIVTDITTDDFHEQLVRERKGYVRRVATRAINRDVQLDASLTGCKHIFECLILVGLDMDSSQAKVPYIKMKFPVNACVPHHVEYLCFPDTDKWPIKSFMLNEEDVELCYTIILTTHNGQRKYGYCRRVLPEGATKPLPLAYCILSPHKAGHFYFSILEELESRHGQTEQEFMRFIQSLYSNDFPMRGHGIKIVDELLPELRDNSTEKLELFKRPLDNRLEDVQLAKTLSFLRLNVFLQIFSGLLVERKVILFSSSVSKLSTCVDGLQTALLPFNWQHTLISIVPSSVISVTDLCQAPTPYFIGLLKSINDKQKDTLLPSFNTIPEVMIVDIDENKILKKVDDKNDILPFQLLKSLKNSLQYAHSTSAELNTYNLLACETFMRLFVELIGHYRHYIIVSDHAKKKMFQKEAFIRGAHSRYIRLFLEWFTETAMFTSFIESRLHTGPNSRGLFEQRCNEFHEEFDRLKQQKTKQNNRTIIKQIGDRIKDLTLA